MNTRQINIDLFNYSRRKTVEVNVGGVWIGSSNPVRVQSMTNTSTMDTEGSVEQVYINLSCIHTATLLNLR